MEPRMRFRMLGGALVVAIACLTPLPALAAEEAQKPPAMSPEEKAMMEKWSAFAAPGEEHKVLARREGSWTMHVTMWMAPGAPPQVSDGTSEARMILGGRYLEDTTKSTFNGMPFEGRGLTGFDNARKKFVFTWIDNMATGIMTGEGTYNPKTKTYTSVAKSTDPMTGKTKTVRGTDTTIDDDTWKSAMYDKTPDGKEFKTMEIVYKRKK
jgi:hypothetical protein